MGEESARESAPTRLREEPFFVFFLRLGHELSSPTFSRFRTKRTLSLTEKKFVRLGITSCLTDGQVTGTNPIYCSGQPPCCAARFCSSSGDRSSMCVAKDHVCPKGSCKTPMRSP